MTLWAHPFQKGSAFSHPPSQSEHALPERGAPSPKGVHLVLRHSSYRLGFNYTFCIGVYVNLKPIIQLILHGRTHLEMFVGIFYYTVYKCNLKNCQQLFHDAIQSTGSIQNKNLPDDQIGNKDSARENAPNFLKQNENPTYLSYK